MTDPAIAGFHSTLANQEAAIDAAFLADKIILIKQLTDEAAISSEQRLNIQERAVTLIDFIHDSGQPGLMDQFLTEYGLSTNAGIVLMCLVDARLRAPDAVRRWTIKRQRSGDSNVTQARSGADDSHSIRPSQTMRPWPSQQKLD